MQGGGVALIGLHSAATDDRKVAGSNAACAASKLGLVVSPSIACVVFRAESSP